MQSAGCRCVRGPQRTQAARSATRTRRCRSARASLARGRRHRPPSTVWQAHCIRRETLCMQCAPCTRTGSKRRRMQLSGLRRGLLLCPAAHSSTRHRRLPERPLAPTAQPQTVSLPTPRKPMPPPPTLLPAGARDRAAPPHLLGLAPRRPVLGRLGRRGCDPHPDGVVRLRRRTRRNRARRVWDRGGAAGRARAANAARAVAARVEGEGGMKQRCKPGSHRCQRFGAR
jgi:hypothetical protein